VSAFYVKILQLKVWSPIEMLEPLPLLQLGMKRECLYIQHLDKWHQPPNAIDG